MSLDEIRTQIDALDAEILTKLNARAELAIEIGKIKQSTDSAIYVPEREKAVYAKLAQLNSGPLSDTAVKCIYREVISAIRDLERATTVAYLGPPHTFSHLAAQRVFGGMAELNEKSSLSDVFTEVEQQRVDYGIVPVESSMGGGVSDTLDRFITSDLKIINEVLLHITQNLMSKSALEAITSVYSKDQCFIQCRNWLQANLPRAKLNPTSSTTEAAQKAAELEGAAAIGSILAAEPYGLNVVAERIEDAAHNFTRFFVIARHVAKATGSDKTSLLISLRDRPGALQGLLLPLADIGINMTRIESRPSRKKAWEYVFFVDFKGHIEDEHVHDALEIIRENSVEMKVLGSYPEGDEEM